MIKVAINAAVKQVSLGINRHIMFSLKNKRGDVL